MTSDNEIKFHRLKKSKLKQMQCTMFKFHPEVIDFKLSLICWEGLCKFGKLNFIVIQQIPV